MKYINCMKYLVLCMVFLLLAVSLKSYKMEEPEGFTTYFRQTIRPHMRRVDYARQTIMYHVNNNFQEFGKRLGFF